MNSIPKNGGHGTTLSYVPYFTAKEKTIKLTMYADMFEVKQIRLSPAKMNVSSARRGKVTEFSRKSRKRMIEKLLKKRNWKRVTFITLTYPDEVYFDCHLTPKHVKQDLDTLIKRFRRDSDDIELIWRIEWETRKSGNFEGKEAPHFHLIIDGYMGDIADYRKEIANDWYEILKQDNPDTRKPRIDVQTAKNRRHAMYYLSKYVAKEALRKNEESICELFHNPEMPMGRHWGTTRSWDISEGDTIELSEEQFIQMRRYIRNHSKRRNRRYYKIMQKMSNSVGFSYFGLGDELKFPDDTLPLYRLIEYIKEFYPSELDVKF